MSGERLFRANVELAAPDDFAFETIRNALEQLADELMVDISVESEAPPR